MVHRTLNFISDPDATSGTAGLDDHIFPTPAAALPCRIFAYRSFQSGFSRHYLPVRLATILV